MKPHEDEQAQIPQSDDWDGITVQHRPLPRWWRWGVLILGIWALGYLMKHVIDGQFVADTLIAHRKVGVPYSDEQIEHARADFLAQADMMADISGMLERYPGAQVRNFDGQAPLTEMDALVAYLQVLGTMVVFSSFEPDASR